MEIKRFEVYLINLDPFVGKEMSKTRPGLVLSPNEMNKFLSTVIIAPLTTSIREYPTRITCTFRNKTGQIALDQIKTIDKQRMLKKLGEIDTETGERALNVLSRMFEK